MPRIAKQFIYGAIYLVIFAGIGTGIYFLFLKPAPSCFDHIQNQNEAGVDCGPVCGTVCLSQNFTPIETLGNASVFRPDSENVSVLAKIQNANADVAARHFDYEFDLYDPHNTLVKKVNGTSFLYAQEIKYIAEFLNGADLARAARAEFSATTTDWIAAANFLRPSLAIQDKKIGAAANQIQLDGKIANTDTLVLPRVSILAVFYSQVGTPVGVSQTEMDNLSPGESRAFTIVHPVIPGFDPARTEIVPYAERP